MQAVSSEHKDFGQPVVSSSQPGVLDEGAHDGLLTSASGGLLPCPRVPASQWRFEHGRVVNALWISPAAVAAFARAWRAKKGPNS